MRIMCVLIAMLRWMLMCQAMCVRGVWCAGWQAGNRMALIIWHTRCVLLDRRADCVPWQHRAPKCGNTRNALNRILCNIHIMYETDHNAIFSRFFLFSFSLSLSLLFFFLSLNPSISSSLSLSLSRFPLILPPLSRSFCLTKNKSLPK